MGALLGLFEAATTRWPGITLAVLVAITVALGTQARTLEIEVDLTQFGREDSPAVQAMGRIQTDFGDPTAMLQVILDTGEGGNALSAQGLRAMAEAEALVMDALGEDVRRDDAGNPRLQSLHASIRRALASQGISLEEATDAQVSAVAAQVLTRNPELAALLSDDLDVQQGRARATFIVAQLTPTLDEAGRTAAGERVADAFRIGNGIPIVRHGPVDVAVFSSGLLRAGMGDAALTEIPLLFGLALLVVLVIMAFMYRSVFDVAVGAMGLVVTLVWTFGFIALLGPDNLGWTGQMSQLGIIVPVLLVGLGIDYSVHLTSRYREQRAAGERAEPAAGRALRTAGTALVLATVGTAIGFAANALAPLRIIADFGVFVAIGVVCAFVVMALLVPAARVLRDRRRAQVGAGAIRPLGLGRLMHGPTWLAMRVPAAGLAVAVVLAALSLWAATDLTVEFNRDQFVPEGSDVEAVLGLQKELFGANVNEATFVVIDGNFTDPAMVNAVWEAQQGLAGLDGVRTVDGRPQVRSVLTLVAGAVQQNPEARDLGWTGDGFAPNADMAAMYDILRQAVGEEQISQLPTPDNRSGLVQIQTTAGDLGANRLRAAIAQAFAPVEELGAGVVVTSEPIIFGEMSDDLSDFQAQAIALTLGVVLLLLAAYYWLVHRRILLGAIAMIPAGASATLVLGVMWVLGISFNVMTATLTALVIGIGVPYGVHVVNRFVEERQQASSLADACGRTMDSTGGALTGSALTTLGAFVVLAFSGLPPVQNLGLLGGFSIAFALLAALLVEPGALVYWDRWTGRGRRGDRLPVSASSVPVDLG